MIICCKYCLASTGKQHQLHRGWKGVGGISGGLPVQVGTAVVTRQDKRLAVGRLGALVEQIEALVSKDLQVILVRTSLA